MKFLKYFMVVCLALQACVQVSGRPWGTAQATDTRSAGASSGEGQEPGRRIAQSNASEEVVVAVVDSGVWANHPSLQGRLLPGADLLSTGNPRGGRSANFAPDESAAHCEGRAVQTNFRHHGTDIASLIAGNGWQGMQGVNPSAKILPVRVFGACAMSRTDLLDALAWAGGLPVPGLLQNRHPARVINLSFSGGHSVCGPDLQHLVDQLAEKKIFVVAAAGNSHGRALAEPANCHGVISVGALDATQHVAAYSALDPRTVLYALGQSNHAHEQAGLSWLPGHGLGFEMPQVLAAGSAQGMGTSYAAPRVSGYLSRLLASQPAWGPYEFLQQLPLFSVPLPTVPQCPSCRPRALNGGGLEN